MENIEYIIVGGPQHGQHGLISRHPWKTDAATPLAEPAGDGLLCRAAARRHGSRGTRYLLLHPQQFLTMLDACTDAAGHAAWPFRRRSNRGCL
jgi:hypothetical protein